MKKLIIIFILLVPALASAQTTNDIFNPNVPVVFFGSDFSQIQFTKSEEFNNKPDIVRFFVDCNNYFELDPFPKMLRKKMKRKDIQYDLSYVNKNNASVEWQKVFSDNTEYGLSDGDIENAIKKLNINQEVYKNSIGMVFCEENYSKTKLLGTVAVVFFSMNDLQPLLIKHYSFKPSGFGFLYYWSSINYMAIKYLKVLHYELKQESIKLKSRK